MTRSAAALQMARDGLDVVFLERGSRPGEKNVISGVLVTNKLTSLNSCPHPPFTVFRSQFDPWFAQQAVDSGAQLFAATLVGDLLWENGHVVGVRTRRGDLRAHVVIGADGVMSTLAEKPGLCAPPSSTEVSLIVRIYGNGVLLAGDAGRFVTEDGVGSWPARPAEWLPAVRSGTPATKAAFQRTHWPSTRTYWKKRR